MIMENMQDRENHYIQQVRAIRWMGNNQEACRLFLNRLPGDVVVEPNDGFPLFVTKFAHPLLGITGITVKMGQYIIINSLNEVSALDPAIFKLIYGSDFGTNELTARYNEPQRRLSFVDGIRVDDTDDPSAIMYLRSGALDRVLVVEEDATEGGYGCTVKHMLISDLPPVVRELLTEMGTFE